MNTTWRFVPACLILLSLITGISAAAIETHPYLIGNEERLLADDRKQDERFGSSVCIRGEYAAVGKTRDADHGANAGAVYLYRRTGSSWEQTKKIFSNDIEAGDLFGYSVALEGDTLVVAASCKDVYGDSSGAVYVFERNRGGIDQWGQAAKIIPSSGGDWYYFGNSVAISGDTIIVGERGNGEKGSGAGAAYIYRLSGDSWILEKKITGTDTDASDNFGMSVDITGDVAAIGAMNTDNSVNDCGSAYVFYRNRGGTNNWGEVTELRAGDESEHKRFGQSVSVSGDVVVVGARNDSEMGQYTGAAYVFERDQGGSDNWGQKTKLMDPNADDSDNFGESVSIDGGLIAIGAPNTFRGSLYVYSRNRGLPDGWESVGEIRGHDDDLGECVFLSDQTVIVAAPTYNDPGSFTKCGAAFIYDLSLIQESRITPRICHASDYFGFSVSVHGKWAIIGAYGDSSKTGAAYILEKSGSTWIQKKKIENLDGRTNDYFGISVAIHGDTAVIGSPNDDDKGDASGSAFIFEQNMGGPGNWGLRKKLLATDGDSNDAFGFSVAIYGDTVIVGAKNDEDLASNCGSAYVFERNRYGPDNWGEVKKLLPDDGSSANHFGHSVSLYKDTAGVGALEHGPGAVYIYGRDEEGTDKWGQIQKLTPNDGENGDDFGNAVSIFGDTILVGAKEDSYDTHKWVGSAYFFQKNGGIWSQTKKVKPDHLGSSSNFGCGVSVSGNLAIIGCMNSSEDNKQNTGAAYVYERTGASWEPFYKFLASDLEAFDHYGYSVANHGGLLLVGAYGKQECGVKSGVSYLYETGPMVQSIERFDPIEKNTGADTVTFLVTFNENVHNVQKKAFSLHTEPGQKGANIATLSSTGGTSLTVSVNTVLGPVEGSIRLDLINGSDIYDDYGTTITIPHYGDETYTIDRLPPVGSITINGGADITSSTTLDLELSATDNGSGVEDMRLQNTGFSWHSWEPFTVEKTWLLEDTSDGEKIVMVEFSDAMGHVSKGVTSDTIHLDRTPPSPPGVPTDEGAWTGDPEITFKWKASYDGPGGSGVSGYDCRVGTSPGGGDVFEGKVGIILEKTVTGEHGKTYYCNVRSMDRAGFESEWSGSSDGIAVDLSPPLSSLDLLTSDTLIGVPVKMSFLAADEGGCGVASTSLWVKTPGSGSYMDTGLSDTHSSGTFVYPPDSGDGTYEFISRSSDLVGNMEPEKPTPDVTILYRGIYSLMMLW